MAKILTIEIDTAQIRDTKSLGNLLKEELIAQGIKTRKVFFQL